MKKTAKFFSVFLITTMLMSLLAVGASAAGESFKVSITADNAAPNVGDTVTATVTLNRTDAASDYLLYNFTDYVMFNSDFLTYLGGTANADSFRLESGTSGSGMDYNGAVKFLSLRYQYTSTSGTPASRTSELKVATLRFKVKADCQTELQNNNVQVWTSPTGNGGETSTYENASITAGTPKYYSVSFSGGTGASGSVAAMNNLPTGTYITLPAASSFSKTGYTFGGWYDGKSIHSAGESFYVTADTAFTAAWNPVYVTIQTVNGGDVACVSGKNVAIHSGDKVLAGTSLIFTATPNKGYTFSSWSDGSAENPHTVIATSDLTMKANFASPSSGGGADGETKTGVPVLVDGKDYSIGTSTVSNDTTTVTVDQKALETQLSTATSTVVVPVAASTSTAGAALVVENIETMAEKNMTLSVEVGSVSYDMRATAVDTAAVMTGLGATDPAEVPVNVTVRQLDSSAVTISGGELVIPPVAFTVTASYGGKTYTVDTFEKYVSRVISIPSSVDPTKITTAVVVENGTLRHVPTYVYLSGDKWYARINSLTDSTYALIYNVASFADASGKWYEATVSEMASRKIINGRSANVFDGDGNVTRAEFAAILVRSLGLPAEGTGSFSDVAVGDWFAGSVGAAVSYKLINGYEDGTFRPNNNITRQEAMAMIQRAAKVTELGGSTGSLSGFSDASSVAAWAKTAAQFNVGSGLIVGSNGTIRPTASITRAESATVILRLLQKSGLVDIRSAT